MALKPQNERETAHRIFKYYKATGEFPTDKTPLESYHLLAKYHYFIADSIDKQTINTLTEIINNLQREKILIVYGDFLLETLKFGLKSFNNTNVTINYIDCNNENIDETLSNALLSSTNKSNTIVYIIDNIEEANKESLKLLVKFKEEIANKRKFIVCCTQSLDGLSSDFKVKFKRIQFGKIISNDNNIRKLIYLLFNNENRELVYNTLIDIEISYEYLFSVAAYNLPTFFGDNNAVFNNNLAALTYANSQLHKIDDRKLIIYLTYAIQTTKTKRVIRFPPKNFTLNAPIKKLDNNVSVRKKSVKKVENSVKISKKSISDKNNNKSIKGGLRKFVA